MDEILTFESLVDGEMTAFTPLYDAVGNLRVMVDETGEPVERYMYTPYGKRFVESKGAAPTIHQVRLEHGEFIVELSEAVQMSPVETALNDTLTVQNSTRGIAIPLELSQPVEQGPMAGRRWVLSLAPAQPQDLQAGDQLELIIPHTALVDFFDQEASTAISSPSTYSPTGLQVLHDTASPQLKHACNSSGTLELTFSETPDLAAAASQLQLNGNATTWSLAADGYTLVHTGPALSGEQTLSFGTGAFDLSGNALAATESITFQADQSHIWSKPEPSAIGNRYGFKGLPIDEETGLLYVRNRYYDPEMGRFIQPDPYGYTDGPSQYQFALNNPVDFSDPTGEFVPLAVLGYAALAGTASVGLGALFEYGLSSSPWGDGSFDYGGIDMAIDFGLGAATFGLSNYFKGGKVGWQGAKLWAAHRGAEVILDVGAEAARAGLKGEEISAGGLLFGAALNFGIGEAGAAVGKGAQSRWGRASLVQTGSSEAGELAPAPRMVGFNGQALEHQVHARLNLYSAEDLFSIVDHFTIEIVGSGGLHTHMIEGPGKKWITMAEVSPDHYRGKLLRPATRTVFVALVDPQAAKAAQKAALGANLGPYCMRNNSCLTTAVDILLAGAAEVPNGKPAIRRWAREVFELRNYPSE